MRTRASVLLSAPGEYETVTLELDDPRQNELRVRMVASGLCHSDDHLATGDFPGQVFPFCGGHEGAGVVDKVGPNTVGYEVGDHVVMTFLPACGKCLWCSKGMQQLCDLGMHTISGDRFDDPGSYRLTLDGVNVGQMCGISTFSEYTTVSVDSVYKVPKDLPLDKLCLLGCAIGTGWGTAVNVAEVRGGQTVIVMGMGGIGTAAVQGAANAGATHLIVVDPVAYKRELAPSFGATEAYATIEEATERAQALTNGHGADSAIVTIGRTYPSDVTDALNAIRKGGIVALTGLGSFVDEPMTINLGMFAMFQKTLRGVIFGNWSPHVSIPVLIEQYRSGQLKLDEMVTRTYSLDEVAQGYRDMKSGNTIRGVVIYN